MTELAITQDDDAVIIQQDGLTVIATDQTQVDVIQTFDQGPPGIRGPQGPQGIPGPEGVAEAPMDGQTYGRKVAEWVPFGGITACSVGDTAPAHAPDGSLWFETDSGLLFLKYNDGDSTQWVVTPKVGGLSDGPQDGHAYGRKDGDWARVAPTSSPQLTDNPTAPTQTIGKNDNTIATTAFVQAAVAIGGTGGGSTGGPTPATSVIVTPTGNVNSTDAQSAITELDANKVAKAGDSMSGQLTLLGGAPTLPGHVATKGYIDGADTAVKSYADTGDATTLTNAKGYADTGDTNTLNAAKSFASTGDTSTLAAAKSYTDSIAGGVGTGYVLKSGDTMSGSLTVQTNLSVTGSSMLGATSLGATTVNGVLTVGSNVVYSNQFRMNGTTHSVVYDGTNTVIRQGGGGTYFQRGDGGVNFAWIDNAGGLTVTGVCQFNSNCQVNGNSTVLGSLSVTNNIYAHDIYANRGNGTGVLYLGGTNAYLFYSGANFTMAGGPLFINGAVVGGNGTFSPSNVDGANLIATGSYGGGVTLQDGNNRGSMWTQSGNLILATGGTPPTVRLTLGGSGNHQFEGNLNVNGVLNCLSANFYLANQPCITRTAPFTTFYDTSGNQRIILGDNSSIVNYHRNNNHFFKILPVA